MTARAGIAPPYTVTVSGPDGEVVAEVSVRRDRPNGWHVSYVVHTPHGGHTGAVHLADAATARTVTLAMLAVTLEEA